MKSASSLILVLACQIAAHGGDIPFPSSLGSVSRSYKGSSTSTVVCVINTDPDQNTQEQLAGLMQYFHNEPKLGPIQQLAFENADGALELSEFRVTQDKNYQTLAAHQQSFPTEGNYALVTSNPSLLWDLEDPQRFQVNLQMLERTSEEQLVLSQELEQLRPLSSRFGRTPEVIETLTKLRHRQLSEEELRSLDVDHLLTGLREFKAKHGLNHEEALLGESIRTYAARLLESLEQDEILAAQAVQKKGTLFVICHPHHAAHLVQTLEQQGISYLVLTPASAAGQI